MSKGVQYRTVQWPSKIMHFAWVRLYSPSPRSPQLEKDTPCISYPLNGSSAIRVRWFRFQFVFRFKAKWDSFRFRLACLSENFASFFRFFSLPKVFFSLRFPSIFVCLLRYFSFRFVSLPYYSFIFVFCFRIFLFALLRYRVFLLLRFASVFFVLLQSENK